MAELISNEPLRDELHASASELSALQAGARPCVKWCLPERLPEASQHMVHQADGLCAWEVAQRAVLCGSAPFPMLPTGEAYDLRPPLSASPSRLASVRGPGVSRVRSCASSVVH